MALFFYQFTPLYGHNPKKDTLSVKFERNLGVLPRTRKNPHHHWHGFQIIVQLWRSASHLVLIRFRLTTPLSQAPLLGQDELTRRKRDLDTRWLSVRLHTLP